MNHATNDENEDMARNLARYLFRLGRRSLALEVQHVQNPDLQKDSALSTAWFPTPLLNRIPPRTA